MRIETLDRELRGENPLAPAMLAALDLDECETDLALALTDRALVEEADSTGGDRPFEEPFGLDSTRRRAHRPSAIPKLLLGLASAAAIVLLIVLVGARGSESPTRAYAAELVRYAESTPLLLLDRGGWRVNHLQQEAGGRGMLGIVTEDGQADQRWVLLSWLPTAQAGPVLSAVLHPRIDRTPGRRFAMELPNLGGTVHIDTRAESAPQYGHPGDHEMSALWEEEGHVVTAATRVTSFADFRRRLEGLRRVDVQTWLDALPAGVVKEAEYAGVVQRMLEGIPLPPGFRPSQVPHAGLSQDRYQVGAIVGGAVACAWFRSWGEARADGDTSGAAKAERVLLGSEGQWPIFREMAKEGAYPATVIEYARRMRSGRWYGKPLLRAVFGPGGLCEPEESGG